MKEDPKVPQFDVSTAKSTYKAGETVTFSMKGVPDYVTFFSGERGLNWDNVARKNAAGTPKLQFTSARANGTQAGSLAILVSSNFAGVGTDSAVTAQNIAAATWTDITAKATLSTGSSTASGAIDLSEFAAAGKPVFIAFKYTGKSGTIQNKWTISALTVTNTLGDGSVYTIANLTATAITNYGVATLFSPGWVAYKVSNNYNWVITSGTSLVITGPSTVAASTADSEAWTFSGPIDLTRVSNDIGVAVKESSTRLASNDYTYVYKTPGTYTATMIGSNTNIYGQKEVVKQISITVTP